MNIGIQDYMFFDRTIAFEPRIWDDFARLCIYLKLPCMIIICELISNNSDHWKALQIEHVDMIDLNEEIIIPKYVKNLILYFYERYLIIQNNVSEHKRMKLLYSLDDNFIRSGTFKSLMK